MTVTRSQTGKTPRHGTAPRPLDHADPYRRKPTTSNLSRSSSELDSEDNGLPKQSGSEPVTPSATNGSAKRGRGRPPKKPLPAADGGAAGPEDYKVDATGEFEFGGPWGVTAIMVAFPLLMWYMWIGATYYDGKLPLPSPGQTTQAFFVEMANLVRDGAYPHARAWLIYWAFFVMEGLFYLYLPGVYAEGKPLPHLGGKKLQYYCSGVWSFYVTIALAFGLHFSGVFKLYTIIDEFGPIMTVSILSGILVSIVAYVSARYRGAEHRMTGVFLYDFFMGAELNPRLLHWLDFKMFFEVRMPWFILFFMSLAAATKQYEERGFVAPEMAFVLMAHFLYANACCKGEQLITTSWYRLWPCTVHANDSGIWPLRSGASC
jgi:delta24(24(1))-sterol reductase